MTLYLKVTIGKTSYLVATARVVQLGPADEIEAAGREIDCRLLFGAPSGASGHRVVFETDAGTTDSLVVDWVEGLVRLDEESFRPLPPIGKFGAMIDAVSLPLGADPPALRLQIASAPFIEVVC